MGRKMGGDEKFGKQGGKEPEGEIGRIKVENRRMEVVKTKGRERPEAGDAEFPPFGRM